MTWPSRCSSLASLAGSCSVAAAQVERHGDLEAQRLQPNLDVAAAGDVGQIGDKAADDRPILGGVAQLQRQALGEQVVQLNGQGVELVDRDDAVDAVGLGLARQGHELVHGRFDAFASGRRQRSP